MKKLNQQGFTLLEMLIASSIFVLLGLASYAVLSSVLQSDKLAAESATKLQKLQRAMMVMERDFLQMAPRQVRLDGEPPAAQLLNMSEGLFKSEAKGIQFARMGWRNPGMMLPRSSVQSVVYRLFEGNLERLHFIYPDVIVGEEPKARILLEDIENLEFRFFTDNKWQDEWNTNALPQAVEIEFESKYYGKIKRLLLTPNFKPMVTDDSTS